MKGWTAKVKKITILGRMNGVNVQVEMEVDYPEGVNGIKVVDDVTNYWHTAGLEPPVPDRNFKRSETAYKTGANGQHPSDLIPFTNGAGDPIPCPNCRKNLFIVQGVVKNEKSSNYGNAWRKWFCEKTRGGCGAYNFLPKMEARFD